MLWKGGMLQDVSEDVCLSWPAAVVAAGPFREESMSPVAFFSLLPLSSASIQPLHRNWRELVHPCQVLLHG